MKNKEIEDFREAIEQHGLLTAKIEREKGHIERTKGYMLDYEKEIPKYREKLTKAAQEFEELCRDAKKVLPVSLFNKTVPKRRRTT